MAIIDTSLAYAQKLDIEDPLKAYRENFYIPKQENGEPHVYLCGNSLGLQPKQTKSYIEQELEDWKKYGVEGHLNAKNPCICLWHPSIGLQKNAIRF